MVHAVIYLGAPLLAGASTVPAGASTVGVTDASGLDDLPVSHAATEASKLNKTTEASFITASFASDRPSREVACLNDIKCL